MTSEHAWSFARKQLGAALSDTLAQMDMTRLRRYRLGRLRDEFRKRDYSACVLSDGIDVRYATGSRNMQVWTVRNPARYVFVPVDGPVVLFDFGGGEHLSRGLETVDEVRLATTWFFFTAGPRVEERTKQWAAEIADLVRAHCGGDRRLAVDRLNPVGVAALAAQGIEVLDANPAVEPGARALLGHPHRLGGHLAMTGCPEAGGDLLVVEGEQGVAGVEEDRSEPGHAMPRSRSLLPDPLPVVELHPVVGARPLLARSRERALHPRQVALRNVVLLHERIVDDLPVGVLGADQVRHLRPTPLARPRHREPLVVLPDAALVLPLAELGPALAPRIPRLRHLRRLQVGHGRRAGRRLASARGRGGGRARRRSLGVLDLPRRPLELLLGGRRCSRSPARRRRASRPD
jgi:Creatinase/Prolidase N-terminal domain